MCEEEEFQTVEGGGQGLDEIEHREKKTSRLLFSMNLFASQLQSVF